jgi:amino acid transporter
MTQVDPGVAQPPVSLPPLGDATLDSGGTDDKTYLHQLGYRQELRRALGFFSSFAVQWTCICIAGGVALSLGAGLVQVGPLAFFAWLIAGAFQLVVALSVAQGVSAYPLAGGAYQIINRILGPRSSLGWQVGWLLVIAHLAAFGTEAYGIAPLIAGWFGINLTSHGSILVGAGILLLISTVLNLVAVKVAAAFNNTLGVIAEWIALAIVIVGLLIAVIFGGSHFHSLSYLTSTHGVVPHGKSVVWPFLFATLVAVFTLSGFDVSGTAGEETKNAARTVPRAMMTAYVGTYVLGTVMILVTLLAIHDLPGTISSSDPIRFTIAPILGGGLSRAFQVCWVLSLFVNMMILQLTAARVIWAQARDGQTPAPRLLTKLSKDHVPITAVILGAVIGFVIILYSGLLTVLLAVDALLWAAAYGVLVGVLIYGKRRSRLPHRPFTVGRFGSLVDAVALVWSAAVCFILIKSDPGQVGWGFVGTIAAGVLIYFVLIPRRRRGILKDVRASDEVGEHEASA